MARSVSCDSCAYSSLGESGCVCRKYAPKPLLVTPTLGKLVNKRLTAVWPTVAKEDRFLACGEYVEDSLKKASLEKQASDLKEEAKAVTEVISEG